ncbi:MAG: hypothetical protein Q9185_002734 [Variospora sp. 1 TL-2023]
MASSTKRACDACHRRKVRCNGQQACGNCSQAGLACTYDAIPQKKGPKGSRAKIISELRLREGQKQADHRRHESYFSYGSSQTSSPSSPIWAGLLSQDLIDGCTEYYFQNMYPTMPILHQKQLGGLVAEMDSSTEAYCLLCSFCAFMLIQPGIETKAGQAIRALERSISSNTSFGKTLLDGALRRRKAYDYVEKPSVNAVITSFFAFGCFFGLDKHNTAWFHLREATTLAQTIGMQDEKTYASMEFTESVGMRRLFWLLFVTERAYALQKHRPLTLHATIKLPPAAEDSSKSIAGFLYMVKLYRPFDDTFIGLWNKSRTDCSTLWLAHLQKQLTQELPAVLDCTETQAADLRTSQHWLRTIVWQLSITNGFLSSTSPDSSTTFTYPIEIAKDLVAATSQLSQRSMEVHGIGLIEKLFDVACTLIDVMSCVPLESPSFGVGRGPTDYLNHLVRLISTLRGGASRYLELVVAKIRDTLPPHMAAAVLVVAAATQPPPPLTTPAIKAEQASSSSLSSSPEMAPSSSSSFLQHAADSVSSEYHGSSSASTSPYSTPPFLGFRPPS